MIDRVLDVCLRRIEEGDFCLVLGAGTSRDALVPDWRGLATSVLAAPGTSNRTEDDLLERLEVDEAVAFDVAANVPAPRARRRGDRKSDVLMSVRKAIYANNPAGARSRRTAVDHAAQVAILAARSSRTQGRARAFDVVTYNYDSLLEEAICRRGHRARALVPERDSRAPLVQVDDDVWKPDGWDTRLGLERMTVTVLHPHGLIPRESSPEEETWHLMLRASDYDSRGGSLRFIENAAQLDAFTARTCLFHGFSFRDHAVRRLLRIAAQVRGVESASGAGPTIHPHVALRRLANVKAVSEDHMARLRQAMEDTWGTWGVRVLWTFDPRFADQKAFLQRLGVNELQSVEGVPATFDFDSATMADEAARLRWGIQALAGSSP